jgi:CDP-diacylglycerol--glycerol-3-phosphate 3-phosphatidyltransferase
VQSSGQVAVLAHLALAVATILAFALVRPAPPARVGRLRNPLRAIASWAYWSTSPVLRAARALRLTADHVTGAGLVLSVAAGVLAGVGAFGWSFVALLWGSAADILDGELARSTGTTSPAGAFLDSSLDRISEIALLAGIAVVLHPARAGSACAVAALAASLMVSYARARGEGLGVACPKFGLERPHRLVTFILALLLCTFLAPERSADVLTYVCGFVALGAGATALGRMFIIHQQLRREAAAGAPSRDWHGTPPGTLP